MSDDKRELTIEERLAFLERKVMEHDALIHALPDMQARAVTFASGEAPRGKEAYDDPEVVIEPNRWKGPSYKGKHFSECPVDYLEAMIEFLDYCIKDDQKTGKTARNGKPRWYYRELDKKRAETWVAKKKAEKSDGEDSAPAFNFEDVDNYKQP